MSCSECSYDSEACTCTTADRCYCSLGIDHEQTAVKMHRNNSNNRDSLFSCRTEDKCYCSVDEGNENNSATTWCDTDSCTSHTKCYCKSKKHFSIRRDYTSDNLALDYELFTIGGGGGKPVKATEAMSVKKCVEMAALFADVKLSQTTDIKNLAKSKKSKSSKSGRCQQIENAHNFINNIDLKRSTLVEDDYQTIAQRPVSATLEDSLGYLP